MGRIKQVITETRAVIDDRCNRLGWTFPEAAAVAGIGEKTMRKKCEQPDLFTGREIRNIAEGMKLNDAQLEVIMKEVFG